LHTLYAFLILV